MRESAGRMLRNSLECMEKGNIIQIIGSVVDVEFAEGSALPEIYNALKVERPHSAKASRGENDFVTLEVVKHLDAEKVRTIALQSTDGLQRGLEVTDTGKQISVPVGQEVLGNIFNVLGETLNKSDKKFGKF